VQQKWLSIAAYLPKLESETSHNDVRAQFAEPPEIYNPLVSEITVRPIGGLGNQLFIYATGFALSRKLGCDLQIDSSWFKNQSKRQYELDTFASECLSLSSRLKLNSRLAATFRSRININAMNQIARIIAPAERVERFFAYDVDIATSPVGSKLLGYFQSWKYFEFERINLIHQIKTPIDTTLWFETEFERLTDIGPFTSIHLRRTDYLESKNLEFHGALGREYYVRAFEKLGPEAKDDPVVIFTDDIRFARKFSKDLKIDSVILDPPLESRPIESLNLMGLARNSVIANSSFSWWGAFIKQSTGGKTIAPSPWFTGEEITESDLIPPNWDLVPRGLVG